MTRALILAALAVALLTPSTVGAGCYSWKCEETTSAPSTPSRFYITDNHRRIIGDLYKPSPDRRIQIKDAHRRIIGFIEKEGTITNPNRQPVANIEALR